MKTNLARYQEDLDDLIAKGEELHMAMQAEALPDQFKSAIQKKLGDKEGDLEKVIGAMPSFTEEYQTWYSEALAIIKQILPDRMADFSRHYEKPKSRKVISFESYGIEDYLQGVSVFRGVEKVVGPEAAVPRFRQQLAILKSAKRRFESSLFDIRLFLQADLFDSEIDAAKELAKSKFSRAAGALAGVVLERHLLQVCDNHGVRIRKKAPGISDLNNALKDANVLDVPTWRYIQHLADIRNLCDHKRSAEPTADQVNDLIDGVGKVTKTVY